MKKNNLIIISLLLLYSCNNNSVEFPFGVFDDSITVEPAKIINLENYNILDATSTIRYKGWTFFREHGDKQKIFKAISADYTRTIEFINIGNGPCDVSKFTSMYINDDSLFIYDPNLRKILNIVIVDDSVNVSYYREFTGRTPELIPLDKDRFLSLDLYDSSFFKIVDYNDSSYFKHPYLQDEILSNLEFLSQNTIYGNCYFTISPSKNKIAFGLMNLGKYGFGEIISNDSICFNEILSYYPLKIGKIIDKCVVPARDNITNIFSAASSDDYVFFLHLGDVYDGFSVYPRRILVYTWDGKPYKIINFKKNPNLVDLHYDAERNLLYGIGYAPECQYVEINLDGIL